MNANNNPRRAPNAGFANAGILLALGGSLLFATSRAPRFMIAPKTLWTQALQRVSRHVTLSEQKAK
jgi:hypothetical protein